MRVQAQARRHPAASSAAKQLRISFLPNHFPRKAATSHPHALPHLPYTPAHLPHRLQHDGRILPVQRRQYHRAHHLRHPAARDCLPLYAQHPLPGRAFRIIQQHGGPDKLPGAEDRGRVAGAAVARSASHCIHAVA
jgi:hypothetical protein